MTRRGCVVGVDVSASRGLDVVVLDVRRRVVAALARVAPEELRELLGRWRPLAVAIDSPPGPARETDATSRHCERAVRAVGVHIFLTPGEERYGHRFYDWIRVGERAYAAAAAAGYPVVDDPAVVRGRALEVFPHASDVRLRGGPPPPGTTRRLGSKRAWRLETLRRAGVDVTALPLGRAGLPSVDAVDATLAAVTALHAVEGEYAALGDDGEWIIVPGRF